MLKHGESVNGFITPEYQAYRNANARCVSPTFIHFHRYGGRGIEFRFKSVEDFIAEVGRRPSPKHSLDRIDNDGHYEKGNVRWATAKEQHRNTSKNHFVTINSVTKTLAEWRELSGLKANVVSQRFRYGWCDTCAVMNPQGVICNHKRSVKIVN